MTERCFDHYAQELLTHHSVLVLTIVRANVGLTGSSDHLLRIEEGFRNTRFYTRHLWMFEYMVQSLISKADRTAPKVLERPHYYCCPPTLSCRAEPRPSGIRGPFRCMFEHGAYLFRQGAKKPLYELVDPCTIFKVLEQRGEGHTRTMEHSHSSNNRRIALNDETD